MKFRPLLWRLTLPYVLVDRLENMTPPSRLHENLKCNRDIFLYGFVRGVHLRNQCPVHIPGCGDFRLKYVSFLPDPSLYRINWRNVRWSKRRSWSMPPCLGWAVSSTTRIPSTLSLTAVTRTPNRMALQILNQRWSRRWWSCKGRWMYRCLNQK